MPGPFPASFNIRNTGSVNSYIEFDMNKILNLIMMIVIGGSVSAGTGIYYSIIFSKPSTIIGL